MNSGRTVFSQLTDFLPMAHFRRCVERYGGDRRIRRLSCYDQFLSMAFGQLTGRESLRDTVTCLQALGPRLYHAGIRGLISRSTLADANESRDWRIYSDLASVLIDEARRLYRGQSLEVGVDLQHPAYAFDSTTIDLCLKLFPWAQFRRRKSAVKLHTLIDLRGSIPCFIHISSGKMADVTSLDHLPLEPGSFYVMDRGYIDFARLYRFTEHLAFFVTRAKKDLDYKRRCWRPVDKSTGLRSDTTIRLCGPRSAGLYPQPLRRDRLLGRGPGKENGLPHEQFRLAGADDCRTVSPAMGRGVVLQVDQAVPAPQGVLRQLAQRGEDSGVDRRLRLRAGGDRAQGVAHRAQHGRSTANPQSVPLRERAAFSGVFRETRHCCDRPKS